MYSTTPQTNHHNKSCRRLLEPAQVNAYFPSACLWAIGTWLCLLAMAYGVTPQSEWTYLQDWDRVISLWASVVLTSSLISLCMPFVNFLRAGQGRQRPSGILWVAMTTLLISIGTNLLLALAPTIVRRDPLLHSKVFIVRWCEWIPLSGLLTFLSDAVDMAQDEEDEERNDDNDHDETRVPASPCRVPSSSSSSSSSAAATRLSSWLPPLPSLVHASSQVLSTSCGLLFPYCPNTATWCLLQGVSWALYVPLFCLVEQKRQALLQVVVLNRSSKPQHGRAKLPNATNDDWQTKEYVPDSSSYLEKEAYDRRYFAYHLLRQCSIVWTCLVGLYYAHALWSLWIHHASTKEEEEASFDWTTSNTTTCANSTGDYHLHHNDEEWMQDITTNNNNMEEDMPVPLKVWNAIWTRVVQVVQHQRQQQQKEEDSPAMAWLQSNETTCHSWTQQPEPQPDRDDTDGDWFQTFWQQHHESLAMWADTAFDVLAKWLYLKVVVEVHDKVFDSNARDKCQLFELRRLMQLLWDSTTDTILISVQGPTSTSTFLSPSFLQSFAATSPDGLDPSTTTTRTVEEEDDDDDEDVPLSFLTAEGGSSSNNNNNTVRRASHGPLPSHESDSSNRPVPRSMSTSLLPSQSFLSSTASDLSDLASPSPRMLRNGNQTTTPKQVHKKNHHSWLTSHRNDTMGVVLRTSNAPTPFSMGYTGRLNRTETLATGSSSSSDSSNASSSSGLVYPPLQVLDAQYIDSSHISSTAALEKLTIATMDRDSPEVQLATELIQACWTNLHERQHEPQDYHKEEDSMDREDEQDENDESFLKDDNHNSTGPQSRNTSFLLVHEFQRPHNSKDHRTDHHPSSLRDDITDASNHDRNLCSCELKISQKSPESFVAIVRDVTERYRRFAAERAHAENLARQKDAQTANRFTRHEIKNGLLSGIELCDSLQRSLERATAPASLTSVTATDTTAEGPAAPTPTDALALSPALNKMAGLIGQVDRVFQEILDTVLADGTCIVK